MNINRQKFKSFIWILIILLPIVFITSVVSSYVANILFLLVALITTSFVLLGLFLSWMLPLIYKPKISSEDVLGSLYDPEEVLQQTNKSEIKKWIKVFEQLGYSDVANQYKQYVEGKTYNFTKLPDPDEIRGEFMKNYRKIKI